MIVGRLTPESLATVPAEVLAALGLRPGDAIGWDVAGDRVVLTRVSPEAFRERVGDFSAFTEWSDELDSAYDHL